MATATTNTAVVGPAPFRDVCGAMPVPDDVSAHHRSNFPSNYRQWFRDHQGTWVMERWVPGIVRIQEGFAPRHGDVVVASPPKCGTTWLKALAFATMARAAYPPGGGAAAHPLLRLSPHDCVPFMEMLFTAGCGVWMDSLPSPRLMATHLQHSVLPASITGNPDCKIVYICREPKDMVVSTFHFVRKFNPDISFADVFEAACDGVSVSGPIWDHLLGYWNASKASPERVLFLRYEEMLRDPAGNVRKLARFLGEPFSPAEEDAGVVADVVRLCSFDSLRNVRVNRPRAPAGSPSSTDDHTINHWYFRKGETGDWANHMTPDMARRLDGIVQEKLRGSGLSFA